MAGVTFIVIRRGSGTARMRRNGIKILTRFIPIPLLASLPDIPHN